MSYYGKFFIPREIFESEIWGKPPYFVKILLWLIGRANYKEIRKGGKIYHRGEFLTSFEETIEANKWTEGWITKKLTKRQVFRVYEFLRKTLWITTRKTTRGLWVRVLDYDYFSPPPASEGNTGGNTGGNRLITVREQGKVKKDKKEREESTSSLRSAGPPSSLKAQPPSEASPDDIEAKVHKVIDFFYKTCIEIKGFKPRVSINKEGPMIKNFLQEYSVDELEQELNWFLGSKESDELSCTIKIALCNYVFNKWLAQRGIY